MTNCDALYAILNHLHRRVVCPTMMPAHTPRISTLPGAKINAGTQNASVSVTAEAGTAVIG